MVRFFHAVAVLVVLSGCFRADAATWFVATNGSDAAAGTNWATPKLTIQAAVDASLAGDTVLVSNGVYATGGRTAPSRSLTNRVVIDKPITVRSVNGHAVTTIQGLGPIGNAAIRCVWMTNGATLAGFTLADGATRSVVNPDADGAGVYAESSLATVSNCMIRGGLASRRGGGAHQGTLYNCTVAGNSVLGVIGAGGGVYQSTLYNCTLVDNTSGGSGGGAYQGTLYNSIAYFNTSTTSNNYYASTLSYSCSTPLPAGAGNITNDPQFVSLSTTNLRLTYLSPCFNAGDNALAQGATDLDGKPRIAGVSVDMGAYEFPQASVAGTRYVNPASPAPAFPFDSWANAATNIQEAVDVALINDLVLVTNGVYDTGGLIAGGEPLTNRLVIWKPVVVRSVNGPAATTIRGAKHPGTTNGPAAVRCVWMADGATLSGFTLTNGATMTYGTGPSYPAPGGGVSAPYSLQCVISNCTLVGNSSSGEGGGAVGGVLYNCTLSGNTTADRGGGTSGSRLYNCLLSGNSAYSYGGGAYFGTLYNCTVVGNSVSSESGYGGGVVACTMANCIVFFNSAAFEPNYVLDFDDTVNFTCTAPLPPDGTGNIDNNPQFVGGSNNRLLPTSPCINVGNNANAPGATDLDGNPRIALGRVDMGTYEYTGYADPDSDGFSDADEYIADTQRTNGASFFPRVALTNPPPGAMSLLISNSSAGRVYGVFVNTNLLQLPQTWTLVPPERTGTASALTLTITNALPAAHYRTGVRLP